MKLAARIILAHPSVSHAALTRVGVRTKDLSTSAVGPGPGVSRPLHVLLEVVRFQIPEVSARISL
jgi:hypothetical protein